MKGELVLKEEKVYILKDEELRTEIIQLHHNIPVAGLVTRNYWWLGVTREVGWYVEGCDLC